MTYVAFPSGTNLKLQNTPVNPKLVKKGIANLFSSKPSGLDSIPAVVLENCDLELEYLLADFSICV